MIYLDNAATTIVAPEVADVINKAMREHWANPSSLYAPGGVGYDHLGQQCPWHPRGEPVRLPDDLRHERKAGNILQLSPA